MGHGFAWRNRWYGEGGGGGVFGPSDLNGFLGEWEPGVEMYSDSLADFSGNNSYMVSVTDQVVPTDFTAWFWVRPVVGAAQGITNLGKNVQSGQIWFCYLNANGTLRFDFNIDVGGAADLIVQTTDVLVSNQLHLVILRWDNTTREVNVRIDNGTDTSDIKPTGLSDGETGTQFQVGRHTNNGNYFTGQMGPYGFDTRRLSNAECDALWNGGVPLYEHELPFATPTHFWEMTEKTGDRTSKGTAGLDLQAPVSPTVWSGPGMAEVVDRSPISAWKDKTGTYQITFNPGDAPNQPVYNETGSGLNGAPRIQSGPASSATQVYAAPHVGPITYHTVVTSLLGNDTLISDLNGSQRQRMDAGSGTIRMLGTGGSISGGTASGPSIFTGVFDGATSKLHLNGVTTNGTLTLAAQQDGLTMFEIEGVGATGFTSALGAFVLQLAAATDEELASMDAYFNAKYSVF